MLDATDAALVAALQRDGRASFQELAAEVGVSREAARARVQRLLDRREVRIVGIVAPDVLGLGALAHVSVEVVGDSTAAARALAGRDAVMFLSRTAGRRQLVADVRARDAVALDDELTAIRGVPAVRGIEVFRCVELVKDAYSSARPELPPRPHSAPDPDERDRALLALLQRDGRTSYTELAERVGLSQAATRARVLRLIETGAVHVTGLVASAAVGVREAAGIGLGVDGSAAPVARAAAAIDGVNFVMTGHGRFDVVCGVDAPDRSRLLAILDRLRATSGVVRSESWVHLEIAKEDYAHISPV
ncbi:Lrp/AsnC family transcriptional regulator [Streptacidiphilus jiangxiensis]|uniref:DNA-binding transcriptional regulator, Lrp family n=1 Tax=Streptacidiphilus jiangxiensis TaxID=235985 RepID=A0A1H7UT47_STRJI|nr:Lrp/AsnC family transcriptional regulator [Streptacidiphilus jiangxiensis]SEM00170.1 DNA-binding transcriptional regulator, Lrp family [Streptacidiphilus jiangxiensis]